MVQAGNNGHGQQQPQQIPPMTGLKIRAFDAAQECALNAHLAIEQQIVDLLRKNIKPEDIEIDVVSHVPCVVVRAKQPKSNILVPGLATNLGSLKRG